MLDNLSAQAVSKAQETLEKALRDALTKVPESTKKPGSDPGAEARRMTTQAAQQTALISGALALPPGPIGVITLVPDLLAVWRRQAQLVADIAAVYNQTDKLDRELMAYCLFRHVSSDALRDVVVRAGQRVVVSRTSVVLFYRVVRIIVGDVLALIAGRFLLRWLPIIGAAGLGAYSYRDTMQVGEAAVETFGSKVETRAAPKPSAPRPAAGPKPRKHKR